MLNANPLIFQISFINQNLIYLNFRYIFFSPLEEGQDDSRRSATVSIVFVYIHIDIFIWFYLSGLSKLMKIEP